MLSPSCCSPASGLDAKRGVREEEEGRELVADGEVSGMVDRVEGREVKSYRGAAIIWTNSPD